MTKNLLLMLALLWATTISAATLWTGEEPISWSGGGSVQVSAAAFADAQVGDELRLNFIFTGQTDWPQVSLRNGNWADLTHAGPDPRRQHPHLCLRRPCELLPHHGHA